MSSKRGFLEDPSAVELLDRIPVGIFVTRDSLCLFVNHYWSEISGLSREQAQGQGWKNIIHPDDLGEVERRWETGAKENSPFEAEYRVLRPDGRIVWVTAKTEVFESGHVGILRNIDDVVEARAQRIESERLFRSLAEASPAAVFKTNPEGEAVYIGPAWTELTGVAPSNALGDRWMEMVAEDDKARVALEWQESVESERVFDLEYKVKDLSGVHRWVQARARPVFNEDGSHNGHIGTLLDVTHTKDVESELREQKSALLQALETLEEQQEKLVGANSELQHRAHHDSLTNLPNRRIFEEQIRRAFDRVGHHKHPMAVLFVDLDGFKIVNDAHGHHAGDAVLLEVADRVRGAIRVSDTVFRVGGDEFIVLLPEMQRQEHAAVVARNIIQAIELPISYPPVEIRVSASVGVATFPNDANDAEGLLRCADRAMYRRKKDGGRGFRFFTKSIDREAQDLVELRADLIGALDRGEFEIHYQPQISFPERRVVGAEALIRWRHPTRGRLAPGIFIEAAEYTGQIIEIGKWVIAEAAEQQFRWEQNNIPLTVAINISFRQLLDEGFPSWIRDYFRETKARADRLELELTETWLMRDPAAARARLEPLRELGFRVAIDDFGTGYSNLASLGQLPVDTIKIDREFVTGVEGNSVHQAIIHSLCAMAKGIGLGLVAEGIETPDEEAWLLAEGVRLAQGFLYAKPMAPEEFERWYARGLAAPKGG